MLDRFNCKIIYSRYIVNVVMGVVLLLKELFIYCECYVSFGGFFVDCGSILLLFFFLVYLVICMDVFFFFVCLSFWIVICYYWKLIVIVFLVLIFLVYFCLFFLLFGFLLVCVVFFLVEGLEEVYILFNFLCLFNCFFFN